MNNKKDTKHPFKPLSHTVLCGNGKKKEFQNYTRSKAIKFMCTECMGFEGHPKDCTAVNCPLFPYRGATLLTKVQKE